MAVRSLDLIAREVRSLTGNSEISARPGVADFRQERFLYDVGDDEIPSLTLFAPGQEYVCGPDEWERVDRDPELIAQDEPGWLLALIVGVVDARREGSERVLGQQSVRFAATVSFSEAASRASRTLERPRTGSDVDLDCLPCKVWLDPEGRIVKAVLQRGRGVMIIELSQFGAPESVELPDPDSVWSAGNNPDH